MSNSLNLVSLNTFRAIEGLAPFADFRPARHAKALAEFEAIYAQASEHLFVDGLAAKMNETPKAPRVLYKTLPHHVPTPFGGAVAFVHGFLSANPSLSRKQAVAELVNTHKVNFATARTQYQRWSANRKAAAKAGEGAE